MIWRQPRLMNPGWLTIYRWCIVIYFFKILIFHSYVKSPEGISSQEMCFLAIHWIRRIGKLQMGDLYKQGQNKQACDWTISQYLVVDVHHTVKCRTWREPIDNLVIFIPSLISSRGYRWATSVVGRRGNTSDTLQSNVAIEKMIFHDFPIKALHF